MVQACQADEVGRLETLLPPEAVQEFETQLQEGGMMQALPVWEPWWLKPESLDINLTEDGTALIVADDSEQTSKGQKPLSGLPSPPSQPLPRVRSLTKAAPSDAVRWQLIDMLYVPGPNH